MSAIVCKCVQKIRNSSNQITNYVLVDGSGNTTNMEASKLKSEIKAHHIKVVNLQMDNLDRLLDKKYIKYPNNYNYRISDAMFQRIRDNFITVDESCEMLKKNLSNEGYDVGDKHVAIRLEYSGDPYHKDHLRLTLFDNGLYNMYDGGAGRTGYLENAQSLRYLLGFCQQKKKDSVNLIGCSFIDEVNEQVDIKQPKNRHPENKLRYTKSELEQQNNMIERNRSEVDHAAIDRLKNEVKGIIGNSHADSIQELQYGYTFTTWNRGGNDYDDAECSILCKGDKFIVKSHSVSGFDAYDSFTNLSEAIKRLENAPGF